MRRAPYRSQFGTRLVVTVGPGAEDALGALRDAGGYRIVSLDDVAAFVRYLDSLHYFPDVVVLHLDTPCAPLLATFLSAFCFCARSFQRRLFLV